MGCDSLDQEYLLSRIALAISRKAIPPQEGRGSFGALALTASNAIKLGVQIAIIPVLGRLLGPSAYGLIALTMPLILLAGMISDAGLGNALVRERASSRELEATIFWLSVGISLALAALICLLAWPVARFFSEPELVPIVIVLSSILPLSGSLSVANARISRERKFGLFAISDVIGTLVSSLAAIGAALMGAGAWSLVIQQCVQWIIKVCWLLPASGFRPAWVCKLSLALPYLSFGLHAVSGDIATFVNRNFPTMVIGSLLGVVAAGHYSMAYQIVRVPELIISGPIYLSFFVMVSEALDDRRRTRSLALEGIRSVVTALAPLFCGLALIANLAVKILLGPAWTATGPMLMLLAPAGFFLCTYNFVGAILMGLGRSEWRFRLILLTTFFLAAGIVVGARFGADGVALGFSAGAALTAPAYLLILSKEARISIRSILAETLSPAIATTAMGAAVMLLEHFSQHFSTRDPVLQLAIIILCGTATFVLVLAAGSGRRVWYDMQLLFAGNHPAASPLP